MSVAEADQMPEQQSSQAPPSGGKALLRGRIEVDLGARLPQYETGEAHAFSASDQRDTNRPMIAFVGRLGVPVRQKPLFALRGKLHKNHLSVVTDGLIPVQGSDEMRFTVVVERPDGVSLAEAMVERGIPFDERTVMHDFLPQFVAALRAIETAGVTHRAIRPENVFFADADGEIIALGEFILTPAGFKQPQVYEPLESASAMPEGRGEGTLLHDTYALGVTLLALLLGATPGREVDPHALLEERLTQSSFTALSKNLKVAATALDLLRGLMCDDPEERWGLNEIESWSRGHHSSTKRAVLSTRAVRPFSFESSEYTYDLALAAAFAREPKAAAEAITSDSFPEWLRVGLRKPKLADSLARMLEDLLRPSRGARDVRGRIDAATIGTILLDPMGPLRRDEVSIAIDGFGPVLAAAFANNDQKLKTSVMKLIASEAPKEWLDRRRDLDKLNTGVAAPFSELLTLADNKALGFGPERCLYELNAGYPCLSPAIARFWVSELSRLPTALDDAAADADKSSKLLDRHVAAFIGANDPKAEKILSAFPKRADQDEAVLALELFAMMQVRFQVLNLRNLARWVGSKLDPLVASYRSRTRREYVKARIAKAQEKGDLTLLQELVNSLRNDSSDAAQFDAAKMKYAQNQTEITELSSGGRNVIEMGQDLGARAAKGISFVILLISGALLMVGV